MTPGERDRFDALVERVIECQPPPIRRLLESVSVVVLDRPTPDLLAGLDDADAREDPDSICGLHSGHAITERSVDQSGDLPSQIHLFRNGIVDLAGGWEGSDAEERIADEIRITLLHELGHEMGLDEDDLYNLGYD